MIRAIARWAALAAIAIDLIGALGSRLNGMRLIDFRVAALTTALALAPCAVAFLATIVEQTRYRARGGWWPLRLPIAITRGYIGVAVLGFIVVLAAMGERFGLFVFLAGIALIALALSQARPRRA